MYIIFNYVDVCMSGCGLQNAVPSEAEEVNGLSGVGITDSCEPPHMGAANQAPEELEMLLTA